MPASLFTTGSDGQPGRCSSNDLFSSLADPHTWRCKNCVDCDFRPTRSLYGSVGYVQNSACEDTSRSPENRPKFDNRGSALIYVDWIELKTDQNHALELDGIEVYMWSNTFDRTTNERKVRAVGLPCVQG